MKPLTLPTAVLTRSAKAPGFSSSGRNISSSPTAPRARPIPTPNSPYNEYGIENEGEADQTKRAATLDLLKRLKAANVPIDALGIQSHISAGSGQTWGKGLRDLIGQAQSMGLEVYLTELDVNDDAVPGDDTAARDQIVAAVYRDYLAVALENKAVKSVLTWGLTDKRTWLNGIKSHREKLPNRPQRPLPFDPDYKPAPSVFRPARCPCPRPAPLNPGQISIRPNSRETWVPPVPRFWGTGTEGQSIYAIPNHRGIHLISRSTLRSTNDHESIPQRIHPPQRPRLGRPLYAPALSRPANRHPQNRLRRHRPRPHRRPLHARHPRSPPTPASPASSAAIATRPTRSPRNTTSPQPTPSTTTKTSTTS
jgi:hypothetical protein